MYKKLSFNFILGGILLSSIYYCANTIKNPSLAAAIALIPISIFSGFIIKNVDICQKYYENSIYVLVITFCLLLILIQLLKKRIFSKNIAISIMLILWFILQFYRHKFFALKK
jgi:hypothetical protein